VKWWERIFVSFFAIKKAICCLWPERAEVGEMSKLNVFDGRWILVAILLWNRHTGKLSWCLLFLVGVRCGFIFV
jgi:hypothetical protein